MTTKKKIRKRPPINARKYLEDMTGGPLTFGRMLGSTRLAEGVSLEVFARRLGVSRAHLCDIEKGRRAVSVERAAEWARKLGYLEAQYVALALQAEVTAAGLDLKVKVEAA
jgi:transcriptional regulator with XRE-family HTH domain